MSESISIPREKPLLRVVEDPGSEPGFRGFLTRVLRVVDPVFAGWWVEKRCYSFYPPTTDH